MAISFPRALADTAMFVVIQVIWIFLLASSFLLFEMNCQVWVMHGSLPQCPACIILSGLF